MDTDTDMDTYMMTQSMDTKTEQSDSRSPVIVFSPILFTLSDKYRNFGSLMLLIRQPLFDIHHRLDRYSHIFFLLRYSQNFGIFYFYQKHPPLNTVFKKPCLLKIPQQVEIFQHRKQIPGNFYLTSLPSESLCILGAWHPGIYNIMIKCYIFTTVA